MSSDRFARVCALFEEMRSLDDGARTRRLESLSAADRDLRGELERMLRAHSSAALTPPVARKTFTIEPGAALGDYRVKRELGSGGMGSVYLAQGPEGPVALKVVHPWLAGLPEFIERFRREATLGARVQHENVVRTYGARHAEFEGQRIEFLVAQYVAGQTLRQTADELGRVPERLCRGIGRDLARALEAIHQAGAVHRDVKPSNVVLTDGDQVKLMDFGVARMDHEISEISSERDFVGSVRYAAPEQFEGNETQLDGRADLYAVGLVLYELAAGEHPYGKGSFRELARRAAEFEPPRLGRVNPQVSSFFEEVVHTLLAKQPDERFRGAAELASVLDEGTRSAWWCERERAIRATTRRVPRRVRIPRETAVYGRDEERKALRRAFDATRSGSGRVFLIEGEAGIGKTRLVDAVVADLHEAGEEFVFLYAAHAPGGAPTGGLGLAFREHLAPVGASAALEEALRGRLDDERLAAVFAARLEGRPQPDDGTVLDGHALYVRLLRSLAEQRPVVVLLDDLHFAAPDERALFQALAFASANERVLLLGTTRPGLPDRWVRGLERFDHIARIPLPRLDAGAIGALLTDAFGSTALADELFARIAERSEGNPFFAFEILRGLRDTGRIKRAATGAWIATAPTTDIDVPSSIRELVGARIAELHSDERALLEVAACVGFEFAPDHVADALDRPRLQTVRDLGRIEKRTGLVRAAGPRFVFDHHQVQETLYADLESVRRQRYHAALGAALEAQREHAGIDALDPRAVVDLCTQFLHGGQVERARPYLDRALRHLDERHERHRADELAELALTDRDALPPDQRLELILAQSERRLVSGRREPQDELFSEARTAAGGDPAAMARVKAQQGWALLFQARFEGARDLLQEALDLANSAGDERLELITSGKLGAIYYELAQYERSLELHHHALSLAQSFGDDAKACSALGNIATALFALGRYDEACESDQRTLQLATELRDPRRQIASAGNLATTYSAMGEFAKALHYGGQHLELSRMTGYRRGEAINAGNTAGIMVNLGRYDEALELHQRQVQLCREIGHFHGECLGMLGMGTVAAMRGALPEAEAKIQEGCEIAERFGTQYTQQRSRLGLARIRYEQGRRDEAIELARDVFETVRQRDYSRETLRAGTFLAFLDGIDAAEIESLLADNEPGLAAVEKISCRYYLWKATGKDEHRAAAYRGLMHIHERTPPEYRESLLSVATHREIVDATSRSS